jgi:glycosyltransferase involved in cell wall biosynthesis
VGFRRECGGSFSAFEQIAMKILFFTKGDKTAPSSRFRVWYVAERLQKSYGFDYEILHSIGYPLWRPSLKRLRILREIVRKASDPGVKIIFVHKSLFPLDAVLLLILLKRFYHKKLIYDLDDAEWVHSGFKSGLLAKNADVVFCGSHAIAEWARKYNGWLEIIPTVIDYELYKPFVVGPQNREVFTLCWQGEGPGHFKEGNIHILKEILDGIGRNGQTSFRFIFIGSKNSQSIKKFFENSPYEIVFIDFLLWDSDPVAVARELKKYRVDLAFNPLKDNIWSRAKCAFKAIEYMACGIPTVQSRVGENVYLVEDCKNGFLFSDIKEGIERSVELLGDLEKRKQFSKNSLDTIKEVYSYQAIIPKIRDIFNSLTNVSKL